MNAVRHRIERIRRDMGRGQGGTEIYAHPIPLEPALEDSRPVQSRPRSLLRRFFSPPQRATALRTQPAQPSVFVCIQPSAEDRGTLSAAQQMLTSLSLSTPAAFEVVASSERITLQVAVDPHDAAGVMGILSATSPAAEVFEARDALGAFNQSPLVVAAYRLQESYVFSLHTDFKGDPFRSLFGALTGLRQRECGGLQVLFSPVRQDWRSAILAASTSAWDPTKSLFSDVPDLPRLGAQKCESRLFAVSIRLFGSSPYIVDHLEGSLQQFGGRNRLIRILGAYPSCSVFSRATYSKGMILNSSELAGLVHVPLSEAIIPSLEQAKRSASPPELARHPNGVILGTNTHRGRTTVVSVGNDWLTRHVLALGATGSGKTVWQASFFRQFITRHGAIYIDPSGDSARSFLKLIPPERAASTIFLDPCDPEFAPSFNVLEMTTGADSDLIRGSLLTSFRRLYGSDGMGPRSEWLLSNALATLLTSSSNPKSLVDLPRLLTDSAYRQVVVASCQDPSLHEFWTKQYPKLPESAILPLLNKLHGFLGQEKIRQMLCQTAKVDLGRVIRNREIVLISLAKGELGESTASVLGFLILATLQQTILALSKVPPQDRDYFGIIIDEATLFLDRENVETITSLLSESRKFKAVTVLATQFLAQADRKVRDALLGNIGSVLGFRMGVDDAQILQKELGRFTAEDLLNLAPGEAIARVGRAQDSFNLKTDFIDLESLAEGSRQQIIQRSQERYCTRRDLLCPTSRVLSAQQQESEQRNRGHIAPERSVLAPEEQAFLRCVYDQPTLSITQAYRAQNLSAYRGDRIKRTLVERRVLSEITTHLGKGSRIAKFLLLTPIAFRLMGVDFNAGDGKGGMLHRYWQSVIRFHAEGKGYRATIEEPIPGSRESVDLGLERGSERIAIEISVTTSAEQELGNVTKCLRAGFGRLIVLMLDEAKAQELTARVENAIPGVDRPKVTIGLVHEFCRFLS